MRLDQVGKVDTADILIIGGGIAGLVAANAAKDEAPDADILVVEKAHVPYGGRRTKGPETSTTWRPATTTRNGSSTTSRRSGYTSRTRNSCGPTRKRTCRISSALTPGGAVSADRRMARSSLSSGCPIYPPAWRRPTST